MKKLLFSFVVAVVTLTSCDPDQYNWEWMVHNTTEQTLKFSYIMSQVHQDSSLYGNYVTVTISPGEVLSLYDGTTNAKRRYRKHFRDYFANIAAEHGEGIYWQIMSEDDTVLKTWNYSERDLPGQRFFEESSWEYNEVPASDFVVMEHSWTFDILPEDISPADQ